MRPLLGLGALCVYVVAELIQFQPNEYDNNKLFYVAYMAMMPAMGLYLVDAVEPAAGRALAGAAGGGVHADGHAVRRAVHRAGGGVRLPAVQAPEVDAAAFIEENTPADAVFLTGNQHNNAVAALTGRDIVCGTGSYLYFHGIDYSRQQAAEQAMLETPADSAALFDEYGVGYAYISSHERSDLRRGRGWFAGKLRAGVRRGRRDAVRAGED